MKMRIITCFGDRTRSGKYFLYMVLVCQTRITYNFMNVSNGVASPPVFSYHCILHYFLTMPVHNLAHRLKPQVSGIKIAPVYRQLSVS